MEIRWADAALDDIERVYDFLARMNGAAAHQRYVALVTVPRHLLTNPRLGPRVKNVEEGEVRRIFIGDYEMRYELRTDAIIVLRIWHTGENR